MTAATREDFKEILRLVRPGARVLDVGCGEGALLELLEQEIARLEAEKQSIDQQLSSGSLPYDQLEPLTRRVGELVQLLDEKGMRWLELSELEG